MTNKQISDLRKIQNAFKEDRIRFVNGNVIIEEPDIQKEPFKNESNNLINNPTLSFLGNKSLHPRLSQKNIFIAFIQDEYNATIYYTNLANKCDSKTKEVLQKIARNAKYRKDILLQLYNKQNMTNYNIKNPLINTEINIIDGILWAIEVENENISNMIKYTYRNKIDAVIQSKISDLSLLHLSLSYLSVKN